MRYLLKIYRYHVQNCSIMDGAIAYRVFNKILGNTPGGPEEHDPIASYRVFKPNPTLQAIAVMLILEIKY